MRNLRTAHKKSSDEQAWELFSKQHKPEPKKVSVSAFYETYSNFKNWTSTESARDESIWFRALFREIGVAGPTTILEVGFGQGSFLDWARSEGHQIWGLEILPEMVERARARGHMVMLGTIDESGLGESMFDLLVAIDVAEHLSLGELKVFFETAQRVLKPAGRLVLRFPNGDSPFFGMHQYGDVTHKSLLSQSAIKQISGPLGFEVNGSIRLRIHDQSLFVRCKDWGVVWLRWLIETLIGYAYFGGRRNLDPNQLLLLTRCPTSTTIGDSSRSKSTVSARSS
jgi:cyclopropane fatty-acyl-phospholipid synthase-like methyltransferase